MSYDRTRHHRRSVRLPGYDYGSPGTYFVTVCVQGRECLLGAVKGGQVLHSDLGRVVCYYWQRLPRHFTHVRLDEWVVMPNHVHGIIVIPDHVEAHTEGTRHVVGAQHAAPLQGIATNVKPGSLGAIVRSFKAAVTKQVNEMRNTPGVRFWQRNYWEHVIRNEASVNRIREYIVDNPARWLEDQLHPDSPPNRFNRWHSP